MSNQANNNAVKSNGAVNTGSKAETPKVAPQAETAKEMELLPTLQVVEPKTANTVFERLEQGIKMKEQFHKAKERVNEFDDFVKNYDHEGLVMSIENVGTGNSIQIQNVSMITDFINTLVKTGKSHLKQLEQEIVNFTI